MAINNAKWISHGWMQGTRTVVVCVHKLCNETPKHHRHTSHTRTAHVIYLCFLEYGLWIRSSSCFLPYFHFVPMQRVAHVDHALYWNGHEHPADNTKSHKLVIIVLVDVDCCCCLLLLLIVAVEVVVVVTVSVRRLSSKWLQVIARTECVFAYIYIYFFHSLL